jgi:hypothetical protein
MMAFAWCVKHASARNRGNFDQYVPGPPPQPFFSADTRAGTASKRSATRP